MIGAAWLHARLHDHACGTSSSACCVSVFVAGFNTFVGSGGCHCVYARECIHLQCFESGTVLARFDFRASRPMLTRCTWHWQPRGRAGDPSRALARPSSAPRDWPLKPTSSPLTTEVAYCCISRRNLDVIRTDGQPDGVVQSRCRRLHPPTAPRRDARAREAKQRFAVREGHFRCLLPWLEWPFPWEA